MKYPSKNFRIIFVYESLFVSVIQDIFSAVLLFVLLYLNHRYLGSSFILDAFILYFFIVEAKMYISKTVKRMNPYTAYEYLRKHLDPDITNKEGSNGN